MRTRSRSFAGLSLCLAMLAADSQAEEDEALVKLAPFLSEHCISCHGPEKQKGEIRFDTLGKDLSKVQNLEIWQGMLDQLNLGQMPPKKEPQPTRDETKRAIDLLTQSLAVAYQKAQSTGGKRSCADSTGMNCATPSGTFSTSREPNTGLMQPGPGWWTTMETGVWNGRATTPAFLPRGRGGGRILQHRGPPCDVGLPPEADPRSSRGSTRTGNPPRTQAQGRDRALRGALGQR